MALSEQNITQRKHQLRNLGIEPYPQPNLSQPRILAKSAILKKNEERSCFSIV
jgi:hypothetical protein